MTHYSFNLNRRSQGIAPIIICLILIFSIMDLKAEESRAADVPITQEIVIPSTAAADALEKTLDSIIGASGNVSSSPTSTNNPSLTRIITINSGCVPQKLTHNIGRIFCNLTIRGTNPANPAKILFPEKSNVYRGKSTDALIDIEGRSDAERISVTLENLRFYPVGDKGNGTFTPSTEYDFGYNEPNAGNPKWESYYMIKIYYAKYLKVSNVESYLENGPLATLDLRACNNVFISGCKLININGSRGATAGGILSIRGNMDNVFITGNTFTKYGNDEMLTFLGHPNPNGAAGIPVSEVGVIRRRNITVSGNRFIYEAPEHVAAKNIPMDVMISFVSFKKYFMPGEEDTTDYSDPSNFVQTVWENVLVSDNEITCKGMVRRVFFFQHLNFCSVIDDFKVCRNKITHEYKGIDKDEIDKGYVMDFALTSSAGPHRVPAPIEFYGNEIKADNELGDSYFGHSAFFMSGASAIMKNNTIDARGFTLVDPAAWQAKGVMPVKVMDYSCVVDFSGNTCLNTKGPLLYAAGIQAGDELQVEMNGNYVDGESAMSFTSVPKAQVRMRDNFFLTGSSTLLSNGFAGSGALWASNNVWRYTTSGSVSVYRVNSSDAISLDRVVFIGNIMQGTPALTMINLPSAIYKVVENNDYGNQ